MNTVNCIGVDWPPVVQDELGVLKRRPARTATALDALRAAIICRTCVAER
jgi:hypothetical protein